MRYTAGHEAAIAKRCVTSGNRIWTNSDYGVVVIDVFERSILTQQEIYYPESERYQDLLEILLNDTVLAEPWKW